jgi:phenazine biosynthesis protein phzE
MIDLLKGPYCLIQKQDDEYVLLLQGEMRELSGLAQMKRIEVNDTKEVVYASVSIVPFCQAKEKDYPVKDGGEKIYSIFVEKASEIYVQDLFDQVESVDIALEGEMTSNYTEQEYQDVVTNIIEKEIKNGEGCNFVIPRRFYGQIREFDGKKALTVFKALLQRDYGTYWKFLFFTGEKYFIGSTPERHLEVSKGKVKMNPISGTFRKTKKYNRRKYFKEDLINFLRDGKEVNELFMVLDEELKMMTKMCSKGGSVAGPLLKEMSRLIHTEYLLVGESNKNIIELLRESMFAATVTGSPIRNAFDIITKYEPTSRGYYGSAIVLMGNDEEGQEFLDSPILIRTLEIETGGKLTAQVGATLVRDSVPANELDETKYKISAVLDSLLNKNPKATPDRLIPLILNDDDIHYILNERNQNLSNFWFRSQRSDLLPSSIRGAKAVIIDNDDDFVHMIKHMINQLGASATIVSYRDFSVEACPADVYVVGPGPGNPNDLVNQKIKSNLQHIEQLIRQDKKMICVCLGHQILSKYYGMEVVPKDVPSQGVQKEITLFGEKEIVGFYNTFVPVKTKNLEGVEFSFENNSREILAMRTNQWISFQFHPESILTKNGVNIVERAIIRLLGK